MNTSFDGVDDLPEQFLQKQKEQIPSPSKTRHSENNENKVIPHRRLGPQIAPNRCNTLFKAWMCIIHKPVWMIVVDDTNDFGNKFAKNWKSLTDLEFLDSISVLFLTVIQKRQDGPV